MLASIPARTLNPIRSRRGIPRFSLFGKCSKASGVGAKDRQCLIQRTAVYGPVRTVVWEGRSREAPPYPDLRCVGRYWHIASFRCAAKFVRFWTIADNDGFQPVTVCPLLTQQRHCSVALLRCG